MSGKVLHIGMAWMKIPDAGRNLDLPNGQIVVHWFLKPIPN